MSVYVDRLPKSCYDCVCNDDGWKCGINREDISHEGRREDCPLKEVVRCKECQYWIVEFEDKTTGYVAHFCSHDKSMVEAEADDFCSYGKRKINNPDDSLLTEDSEDCKEQKSKLESDIIFRQSAIDAVEKAVFKGVAKSAIESLPPVEDMGEVSDGYHTFNQLYHQRAVLFATIVNQNKDKAWKSWKHEDGKFCFDKGGEWFIVGVDTPEGSYTYHYEKKCWDLFDCEELDRGKHWDGHTEEDVTRLLSLPPVEPPTKVVAQIKVDVDELMERIKEEYKITDRPVCEDAISREDTLKAICAECWMKCGDDKSEDCVEYAVVKSMPPVEPKPILTEEVREAIMRLTMCAREDCSICEHEKTCGFDKQVELATESMQIILDAFEQRPKGEWVLVDHFDIGADLQRAYDEGFKEGQETERPRAFGAGYKAGFDNASKRPKGEWIIHGEPPIYVRECPKCGAKFHYAKEWGEVNYCSNCGCDCRGDME